jgi:hypothetical protein
MIFYLYLDKYLAEAAATTYNQFITRQILNCYEIQNEFI